MNGAQAICQFLQRLGTSHVFGLPGGQNAPLYAELGHSRIRTIVTTSELSAGFSALGYAATSGKVGVLALIGGPGITYAVTPIIEARLDSIPLLVLVFSHRIDAGRYFGAQQIDVLGLMQSSCKAVLQPAADSNVFSAIRSGWNTAIESEPGPVAVLLESLVLTEPAGEPIPADIPAARVEVSRESVAEVCAHLAQPGRHLLWAGRGTLPASRSLRDLAERIGAAVLTSPSARGVLPEDHPLVIPADLAEVATVNQMLAECDHVLALGIKLSHNSSRGYKLQVPPDRLMHVDASPAVLGANYPAKSIICADVPTLLQAVAAARDTVIDETTVQQNHPWCQRWRATFEGQRQKRPAYRVRGVVNQTPHMFFRGLSTQLSRQTLFVLDSGAHQSLARTHLQIHSPYGLLFPSGLQSMGFSLPAALGARAADASRPICVIMGDGGFRICGMELLTAVGQDFPVTVVVIDDGYFGLIRSHQISYDGSEHGVQLPWLDYEACCAAFHVAYYDGARDPVGAVVQAVSSGCTALVVVPMAERLRARAGRFKARARGWLARWRSSLGLR